MNKFKFISGGTRDGNSCDLYTQKEFYYLGAKCWNILPQDLRILPDVKMFSSAYKNRLLASITTDPQYAVDNSFDYFYKYKDTS